MKIDGEYLSNLRFADGISQYLGKLLPRNGDIMLEITHIWEVEQHNER